jgi:hypothetical protein
MVTTVVLVIWLYIDSKRVRFTSWGQKILWPNVTKYDKWMGVWVWGVWVWGVCGCGCGQRFFDFVTNESWVWQEGRGQGCSLFPSTNHFRARLLTENAKTAKLILKILFLFRNLRFQMKTELTALKLLSPSCMWSKRLSENRNVLFLHFGLTVFLF